MSRTDTATSVPRRSAESQIRPPRSVYLALLVSRLLNTCASRVRSASRYTGRCGSETVSSCPASSIVGRAVSTALFTTSASSTRSRRSSILLRLIRETSSRSSISRTMCESCRSIMSRACAADVRVAARQPQHLQAVADRRQRVPQLVGQQGDEVVLLAVGLAQILLHPPPLGDVPHQARHPQVTGLRIANRRGPFFDPSNLAVARANDPKLCMPTLALFRGPPDEIAMVIHIIRMH